MKISRLRRALAVFLSAAMLIMCTPFAGITAAASSVFEGTAHILAQKGNFSDGSESKEVTITNGKLPEGTLASLTPTRDGYIFGGWYVWSASDDKDVPVDDNYTFTDDNINAGISINIDAYWYEDCTNVTVSYFGELYIGYKPQSISTTDEDIPHFYLDENQFREATLTSADWYCVDKGGTLDLSGASNCNNDTVLDSKDYYLVCTISLENTAYRFSAKPAAAAEFGSRDYTVHSYDATTATISWKITPYEVITELSDISITPDVTSSSYKLAPGDAPAGFTGTAKYTTKSGKTGTINCAGGAWLNEEGRSVYTIEEGKEYIPMFAFEFPGRYYVPASIDYFNVDGMTNLETDSDSYSFDVENSFEAIVLNAKAITSSAGSSVLDKPIEYLENVTLTPVSGDTTGTKFEFGNIPSISEADSKAGYKYIYVVLPSDEPNSAAEYFNEVKNGQIMVNDTSYAINSSFAADLTKSQITVPQSAAVFIAKVNTNYVTELAYYTFAVKVFAVTPEAPENKAEKAAKDITTALGDIKPTNDTTKDDIQAIVDENKGETTATVTTFTLTPATTKADGSLKVTVTVTDGTNTETVEKTYTIEKLTAVPESKAEQAAKVITTALGDIKPTNDTTKDAVQAIVDKNKGETTSTVTTFTLTPATTEADGSLKVTVTVTDGTNTETVEKTYTIEKLPAEPEKHEHTFGAWTVVKEATATEEGLLRRTCTVEGCTEVEEKTIPKLEESKGESESGNVVDTTPEDNSFSAAIPDVTDTAENIELTPDESAAIADGSTLSIFLKVTENLSEDKKEDEKAITDKADSEELTIGSFLDVSLFKQIGDNTPTAVTETKKPIKVSFIVPDELVAEGRAYYIIRTHGSETTIIECEFDAATKTCTFETDKFSSYAIAYKAAPAEEDDIEKFVERLYNYMLGRHSDPEGKANHVANLRNGEAAVKVSFDFVYSDEFKNMGLTNKEIAERLYLTFLDRTPDEAGLADWTATLDGGCSIGHLFYGFTQSNEFTELCEKYGIVRGDWTVMETRDVSSKLTAFVSRMYTKALNRGFDVNGLNNHTANYIENHDVYQLAYDFIFSSEFIEKELSDEDFVDTMYHTFFDREGDPDGRSDWLGKLKSGMSREEVLAGFVGSQECADLVAKLGI